MDHKTLFTCYAQESIADLCMMDGFTVEQLYQAFKARFITEICLPDGRLNSEEFRKYVPRQADEG